MSEIYIVTDGSYEDYEILGVFKDLALAERYAKVRGRPTRVEHHDIIESLSDPCSCLTMGAHWRDLWRITRYDLGEYTVPFFRGLDFIPPTLDTDATSTVEVVWQDGGGKRIRLTVCGMDHDKVRALFAEKAAEIETWDFVQVIEKAKVEWEDEHRSHSQPRDPQAIDPADPSRPAT